MTNQKTHKAPAVSRRASSLKEEVEKISTTDKMNALSLFVSGTAQEIKYPLKAVLVSLQKMMQKYKNRDYEYIGFKEFSEIMNTIQSVNNQIHYCCDIADKLLLLSKKRTGIKGDGCHLHEAIRRALLLFSPQLRAGNVSLKLFLKNNMPKVAINQSELEEVIASITSNALQAMPAGGVYLIKASCEKPYQFAQIEFKDNGVGIAPEILPRVFEPFFTTKTAGQNRNSGLGLSVVHTIVKGCGGDITIKSSLRHGTTVKVILPVSRTSVKTRQ